MTEETDYDDGAPRRTPWLLWVTLLGLVVATVAFSACSRPAMMSDLDTLRADLINKDRATSDAVRDYLIAHPGDIGGAFALQFKVAIAKQQEAKAEAKRDDTVAGAVTRVVATGLSGGEAAGYGGVALALLLGLGKYVAGRLSRKAEETAVETTEAHDHAPFEGPNGEKVAEPRVVTATLWAEKQMAKVGA